jgi:hypothetical protein
MPALGNALAQRDEAIRILETNLRISMKGIAAEIVWITIIAIAGATIFLTLIAGNVGNSGNWLYCNVYLGTLSFLRIKSPGNMPSMCKYQVREQGQVVRMSDTDNTAFSRKLLDLIISCWHNAEVRGLYSSHPCYEVHLSSHVKIVDESNVSQILVDEDHCKSIENSDYGCGAFDQIKWIQPSSTVLGEPGGIIYNQSTILVRYANDTRGRQYVEVFGPENITIPFANYLGPTSGSAVQGGWTATTVTLKSTFEFPQPVSLNCSNLPQGVSCSFSRPACTPNCTSTLNISVSCAAAVGTYSINVSGAGRNGRNSTNYTLHVTPRVSGFPRVVVDNDVFNYNQSSGSSNPYVDAVWIGQWGLGSAVNAIAASCLSPWMEVLSAHDNVDFLCTSASLQAFADSQGVTAAAQDPRIKVIAFEEFPLTACGAWFKGDQSLLDLMSYVKSIDPSKYVGWVDRYGHAQMDFGIGEIFNNYYGASGSFFDASTDPAAVRQIYNSGGTVLDLPWNGASPVWPGGPAAINKYIVSALS